MKPMPKFIFPLVLGAFTALTYLAFVLVYTVQPHPFVDEIFHIPQAQKYCDGNFMAWDRHITTLPGLYLFSIGLIGPVSLVLGNGFCDVMCLRLTNLVGIVFTLCTMYKLMNYLHGDSVDGWKLLLVSFNFTIFPILYWFSFLYYTDVLATLLVLVMMLLHVHKAPNFAAFIGVIAVLMRQTNIVWVGMLGGLLAVDALGYHVLRAPIYSFADFKAMVRRVRKMTGNVRQFSSCMMNVLVDCFTYSSVLSTFVAFVVFNGSIVVGDKENHEPTVHLMQWCYFSLFFLAFSPFEALKHLKPFLRIVRKFPEIFVGSVLVCALLVQNNTLVHQFLLADNRHYAFYIWNRFYGRFFLFKYVVIPIYIFGFYVLYKFIEKNSFSFKLFYFLAVSLCIVPQKLLEFRYFILPFLMVRFQYVSKDWRSLCLESAYFLSINALTMYIFVSKTVHWPDFNEPQRIMW